MIIDPLTTWEDGFPYTVLAEVGITPQSSTTEVKAASYALMERGMTPQQRAAWDTLRFPERRLVVDFFLYRTLPELGVEDPTE
jgi:hypothetical protein